MGCRKVQDVMLAEVREVQGRWPLGRISSALAPNLYLFFQAPGLSGFCGAGRRKVHFLVILLDLFPIKYFPHSEGF